jgi:hypothetical protein
VWLMISARNRSLQCGSGYVFILRVSCEPRQAARAGYRDNALKLSFKSSGKAYICNKPDIQQ